MPLLLKLMLLLMLMGGLSPRVLRRCHRRCHRTSRVVADAVGGAAGVDAGADVTAVASFELVVAFNGRGFTRFIRFFFRGSSHITVRWCGHRCGDFHPCPSSLIGHFFLPRVKRSEYTEAAAIPTGLDRRS